MNSLIILIPVSLFMGFVGLCAFIWAVRTNQFEDLEGNAWRVIPFAGQQKRETPPETEGIQHDHLASHLEDCHPARRL
ncbi:MAG: cytochrome oxidase maturation protein, cbb3-type [Rhodobacterales bacterium 34-62-10]|nr:MAG: cytochrome oxidase maturation protein, cbb3-type [Rhodobacterales bacterium 34-62-10]